MTVVYVICSFWTRLVAAVPDYIVIFYHTSARLGRPLQCRLFLYALVVDAECQLQTRPIRNNIKNENCPRCRRHRFSIRSHALLRVRMRVRVRVCVRVYACVCVCVCVRVRVYVCLHQWKRFHKQSCTGPEASRVRDACGERKRGSHGPQVGNLFVGKQRFFENIAEP
jgi:hypothetical protein